MKRRSFDCRFAWKDWLLSRNINPIDLKWFRIVGSDYWLNHLIDSLVHCLLQLLLLLLTTYTLFLHYHSFIDSKPSKSITIFLVNKRRNGINESKESSVSFMTINDPLIYESMSEWVSDEGKQNEWIRRKNNVCHMISDTGR